ncbi:MAG TPA: hypothetical protein PK876_00275 [Elusimicrobiota bacterium]|nr:hypothetical protein [Elusimicrobiota bacterium]
MSAIAKDKERNKGMTSDYKQISNPVSTGGGGVNFEVQVQASFVALMLTGGFSPCLPCQSIRKIKLQGRHAGYQTDDLVVFTTNLDGSDGPRLLGQVKRSISITPGDSVFGEVLKAAWSDFNNTDVFTRDKDVLALITGPLSATDITDVRTLLEWSRSSEDSSDFLTRVNKVNFSSDAKRKKLQVLRTVLDTAQGSPVTDDSIFRFLRHFHLLGYDLDIKAGVMHAILHSLIGQYTRESPQLIWAQIIQEVMTANQNAGTISRDSLPNELQEAFGKPRIPTMPEGLTKTIAPRKAQDWNTPEFAPALVIANLLGSWNEESAADMAIVRRFVDGSYDDWQAKIREVLQLPDSPLSLRNGMWSVRQREELWQTLGSRVFDRHFDLLKAIASEVFKERDPQFELPAEERFAASIHGKVLQHSRQLRKGLAECLALVGSRPEPLVNCTHNKSEAIVIVTIRAIFEGADWVIWGSLNDLLPMLAEASPEEFLSSVEKGLSQKECPFDALFSQEGGGISGRNYLTGLLWALETLAWDEQYLVRVTVALGSLAERDPGGQWANRPSNSLATIFLPWLPQTVSSIEKRKVAITTLCREFHDIAWKLLLSLLPNQVTVSSHTRRPSWRRFLPNDWKEGVTQQDYWDQVSVYAEIAVEIAITNDVKLKQLIEHLDQLPSPVYEKILEHLSSELVTSKPEDERLPIWNALIELASKHRRFSDADWALSDELVSKVEGAAGRIAPKNPMNYHRRLFSERDLDLYEQNGNWREEEKKLEARRRAAIQEIMTMSGPAAVIRFAENVESPQRVGFALGLIESDEVDSIIMPSMLKEEQDNHRRFVVGFVRGRYRQKGWVWGDSIIEPNWSKDDVSRLLTMLPFTEETWKRANERLRENESDYWRNVMVDPYQSEGDLSIAIKKLIENERPWAAIDCLVKAYRDKQPLDTSSAIQALLLAVTSTERYKTHDVIELIKALQDDPNTNQDDLFKVEWAFLPLLDRHHGVVPKLLEIRLASEPAFFCEAIRVSYRSEKTPKSDAELSEQQQALSKNAYRLLQEWGTVPGTAKGGGFSGDIFKQWVDDVIKMTSESGHLAVAKISIGSVLIYCPPDSDGFWIHRAVADVLNDRDNEDMRHGYSIAIQNARGVHWVDPTGKPEKELANEYRTQAEQTENRGYHRIAAMLRHLAETYDREADNIVTEHKACTEKDE